MNGSKAINAGSAPVPSAIENAKSIKQSARARCNGLMIRYLRRYLRWKKRNRHEDYTKLPDDDKEPHDIALARCDCLIARYLGEKQTNHNKSDRALSTALILTAMIPVVLLVPNSPYVSIVAALFSAGAAIATGLLAISGWRENYIRYGYIWHALQSERYRYLTRATEEYSNKEKATKTFSSRVEQLVMADVTDWRDQMQKPLPE